MVGIMWKATTSTCIWSRSEMMNIARLNLAAILLLCTCSTLANAKVLPGLVDELGNPVHTADEFTLHISATVTPAPQGYKYLYSINNDALSNQSVWAFKFFFQDPHAIVQGTASTPWEIPTMPTFAGNNKGNSLPIWTKSRRVWSCERSVLPVVATGIGNSGMVGSDAVGVAHGFG